MTICLSTIFLIFIILRDEAAVAKFFQLFVADPVIPFIMPSTVEIAKILLHILIDDAKSFAFCYEGEIPSFPAELILLALIIEHFVEATKKTSDGVFI